MFGHGSKTNSPFELKLDILAPFLTLGVLLLIEIKPRASRRLGRYSPTRLAYLSSFLPLLLPSFIPF